MRKPSSLETYLQRAQKYASQGDILGMTLALDNATLLARTHQQDISAIYNQTTQFGYNTALSLVLKEAQTYAQNNDFTQMQQSLQKAEFYAQFLGKKIEN